MPWECCLSLALPWPAYDALAAHPTPAARFLKAACAAYERHARARDEAAAAAEATAGGGGGGGGGGGFVPCDAFAAAALERPALVTGRRRLFAAVETGGTLARGMVAFDWMRGLPPNVELVGGGVVAREGERENARERERGRAMSECVGEREREREIDRQTDRQTDR